MRTKTALTLVQKVFIVKTYYKSGEDFSAVQKDLNSVFNINTPSSFLDTCKRLVETFESTGSITLDLYHEVEVNAPHDSQLSVEIETKSNGDNGEIMVIGELQVGPYKYDVEYISGELAHDDEEVLEIIETDKVKEDSDAEVFEDADDSDSDWQHPGDGEAEQDESETQRSSKSQGKTRAAGETARRSSVKTTPCRYCAKQFCARYLTEHYRKMHRDQSPYECPVCQKAFRVYSEFKQHKMGHSPYRKRTEFKCEHCQKTLMNISALNRHMKSHLGIKNHVCEWCGRGFQESTALKLHIRTHTGERPFVCNICSKTFTTKGSLDIHHRIHSGLRPFKCKYCDKAFTDSSTRNVHHRQHTGENPYVCHLCGKTCKQGQNLRSHMKHMHGSKFEKEKADN